MDSTPVSGGQGVAGGAERQPAAASLNEQTRAIFESYPEAMAEAEYSSPTSLSNRVSANGLPMIPGFPSVAEFMEMFGVAVPARQGRASQHQTDAPESTARPQQPSPAPTRQQPAEQNEIVAAIRAFAVEEVGQPTTRRPALQQAQSEPMPVPGLVAEAALEAAQEQPTNRSIPERDSRFEPVSSEDEVEDVFAAAPEGADLDDIVGMSEAPVAAEVQLGDKTVEISRVPGVPDEKVAQIKEDFEELYETDTQFRAFIDIQSKDVLNVILTEAPNSEFLGLASTDGKALMALNVMDELFDDTDRRLELIVHEVAHWGGLNEAGAERVEANFRSENTNNG